MRQLGVYESTLRLEETLIPSLNSVDIRRTVETDYYHRFSNKHPNVAELYHINSKITASATTGLPLSRAELAEARDWFYDSAYDLGEDDLHQPDAHHVCLRTSQIGGRAGALLAALARDPGLVELLHGLDVFVLHQSRLLRVIPTRDFLWIERELNEPMRALLRSAFLPGTEVAAITAQPLFFVVGCFWRYMKFCGVRGYRMVLMDAGRLLAELERRVSVQLFEHFYDNRLDEFLLLDGVERSVLSVLALQEESHG